MDFINLIKLSATTSTNDIIKEGLRDGAYKNGDLVWTPNQTQGRGQRKKQWDSEPGKNLALSIYKEFEHFPAVDAFLIGSVVALSVLTTLNNLHLPNIRVKWPNDIMSDNKKIGGILIENQIQGNLIGSSIIGLGLNINQTNFRDLPNASSLKLLTDKQFDLEEVLKSLASTFEDHLVGAVPTQKSFICNRLSKNLYGLNRLHRFKKNKREFSAIIKGISAEGKLVLSDENGVRMEVLYPEVKMLY